MADMLLAEMQAALADLAAHPPQPATAPEPVAHNHSGR
jgi:hypothetical protein